MKNLAFYYFNYASVVPLALAYGLAVLVYWGISSLSGQGKKSVVIRVVAAVILLFAPVSEEFWIAWNFARACDQAGTFIQKKVHADGFYDSTREVHAGPRTADAVDDLDRGGFRFYEMVLWDRTTTGNSVVHFEKAEDKQWTVSILERPTARYHFRHLDPMNGTSWAHKVLRSGSSVVVDTQTGEEIARYISFARRPPWFYVGLDTPGFGCDAPNRWPYTRGSGLIYREALVPSLAKQQ